MKKKYLQNASLLLTTFVISLIALEWPSRVFLKKRGQFSTTGYQKFYDDSIAATRAEDRFQYWGVRPHPYFGYVRNPANGTNSAGFVSNEEYPYNRRKNDFVIGIFGGSMADQLANYLVYYSSSPFPFESTLQKLVPALKDKRIILLNFAHGGWKQPQQFFAFSYFSESLDLSINLDGYNEIAFHPPCDDQFPVDYPIHSDVFFRPTPQTEQYENKLIAQLKFRRILSQIGRNNILNNSSGFFLLWNSVDNAIQRSNIKSTMNLYKDGPDCHRDSRLTASAQSWARWTEKQAQLARSQNIRALFFLQPNQYSQAPRQFTEDEKKIFIPSDQPGTSKGYAILKREVEELQSKGYEVFDLTTIFSHVPATIYSDSCCHVNRLGDSILAAEIAHHTARALNKKRSGGK